MTTTRRSFLGLGLAGASAAALAACSPAALEDDGRTVVRVRLWDDQVAGPYQESMDEFMRQNPGIRVVVNQVPWSSYWDKLRTDASGKTLDDVFWVASSFYQPYAENGYLMDISAELPGLEEQWDPKTRELYGWNGKLWGVPQLSDGGICVYYNKEMVSAEQVADLRWVPGGGEGDTLLPLLESLKKPGVFPYNAAKDTQAIYMNYLASNGGVFVDDDGRYAFADPKTVEAFEYVVDLVNKHKVAPPASDTNTNGDFSRDQFLQGKMALFQSGMYNLKNVADKASFEWGIAPLPAGPAGRVSVVDGVVVCGNPYTKHRQETLAVLKWLGSVEGSTPLARSGAAMPSVLGAQPAFVDSWKAKGVDPTPFIEAGAGLTLKPALAKNYSAAEAAFGPIFNEVFLGRTPVAEGLKRAEDAANAAAGE